MRIAVAVLAALSLIACNAGEVSAQTHVKKRHEHANARIRQPASRAATPGNSGEYVVRDADKLPFGSSIWWDQMLREGRAGTCCN